MRIFSVVLSHIALVFAVSLETLSLVEVVPATDALRCAGSAEPRGRGFLAAVGASCEISGVWEFVVGRDRNFVVCWGEGACPKGAVRATKKWTTQKALRLATSCAAAVVLALAMACILGRANTEEELAKDIQIERFPRILKIEKKGLEEVPRPLKSLY
jgi:hypothetical protein